MKKWISMVSALLVLSLASNVSAVAAEKSVTTTNLTSYGADYLTKTDGSFWVWGGNRSVPTQIHDLNEVQAYFGSQYVMKKDLSVWQWRTSAYSEAVKVTPVQELDNLADMFMAGNRTIALKGDGTILSAPFHPMDSLPPRSHRFPASITWQLWAVTMSLIFIRAGHVTCS